MTEDKRVIAIRADKLVGRGTCSSVDECYSDGDLIDDLNRAGITTPEAAVEHARDIEELHLERGLNQRWGEDTDPQLLAWNEWKRQREGNE